MSKSLFAGIFSAMVLLLSGNAIAQNTNVSPYSRYGLGDINPSTTIPQFSMGGLGTGYTDPTFINLSNPAGNAFLSKTTFDFGIRSNSLLLSNSTQSQKLSTTFVNHFAYAFSIKNRYCLTAGLVPYSRVGYVLRDTEALTDSSVVNTEYKGSGGLNCAFLGNAYKIINRKDSTVLSVGFNVNFLFGTISRESRAYFPGGSNYFNTRDLVYTTLHDFSFDAGTYYSFYPNAAKSLKVNIGASYSFATSIRATQEVHKETFILNLAGNEFPVDTIQYLQDSKGSVKLPQTVSLGTSFVYKDRWVVGIDYRTQNWSTFSQKVNSSVIKDNLKNSSQLAFGVQFTPRQVQIGKAAIFNFMNYRFGLRQETNYIQVRDSQLKGYAVSGGIGIPLKRSNSLTRINLGYELYTRGTTNNNLLKERYSTFTFGLSLSPNYNDRWFFKRKYD